MPPTRSAPGEALWEAFRRDPTEARFKPIYDATAPLAYTLCMRVLRDPELAMDAFQASWARLLLHARRPEPDLAEASLAGLVGRIALREAWSLKKRAARRAGKEFAVDVLPPEPAPGLPPSELAALRQLREQLVTLMRVLPERERLPLELHFLNGLSQTEIAELLAVNKSTVCRRMDHGLRRLRPLARRAGLGESLIALAGAVVAPLMMAPPKAMAAGLAFSHAEAAAATLAAGGGGLGIGKGVGWLLGKLHGWSSAAWAGTGTAAVAGALILTLQARQPAPEPLQVPQAGQPPYQNMLNGPKFVSFQNSAQNLGNSGQAVGQIAGNNAMFQQQAGQRFVPIPILSPTAWGPDEPTTGATPTTTTRPAATPPAATGSGKDFTGKTAPK